MAEHQELEMALDQLYTETERNKPPQTFNSSEKYWNDGFYAGQLKALELVSVRLFNKGGDELKLFAPPQEAQE